MQTVLEYVGFDALHSTLNDVADLANRCIPRKVVESF